MKLSRPVIAIIFFTAAAACLSSRGPYVNEDYEKIGRNDRYLSGGTLISKMFGEESGFERMYYRPLNNLMMAGFARLWGTDGAAGKFRALAALAFGLALAAVYGAARRLGLSPGWALGAAAFVALHPFNSWSYFQASWIGNSLVIPAIALVFAAWERAMRSERGLTGWALLVAFLIYVSCLARDSAGLVVLMLVPLVVWAEGPKRARACVLWGAAAAGAFLYMVQRSFVVADAEGIYNAVRFANSLKNAGGAALQYAGYFAAGEVRNYARPLVPFGGWLLTLWIATACALLLWLVRRRRVMFFLVWCMVVALLETALSLWVSLEMAASRMTLFGAFFPLAAVRLCRKAPRKGRFELWFVALPLLCWYGFQSFAHLNASLDEERFYRFHNEPPYSWKTLFVWGRVNQDRGRWDEAVRAYAKSLDVSNRAVTHCNLGLALWRRGQGSDADDALRHLREAVRIEPSNAGYHFSLASTLESRKDFDGAAAHYFRMLEIDSTDERAYAGLGRAHVLSAAPTGADWDPAGIYPALKQNAAFYNSLAQLYARAGKLDEAERCLGRALEINPGYAKALNNMGMARAERQRFAEAVEYFEQALAVDPGYERARLNLGIAFAKEGHMDKAAVRFREVLRSNPGSEEAARLLEAAEKGER